jgi:hypothetical protein
MLRSLPENSQSFGQPLLVGLATTILVHQKSYYEALEKATQKIDVTAWLAWFATIAIEAQRLTIAQFEFFIAKTKLLDRLRGHINDRQQKALLRMFREGPDGFEGGLSASKFSTITGASPAMTTLDLAGLTEKDALIRTGERKHARYALNLSIWIVCLSRSKCDFPVRTGALCSFNNTSTNLKTLYTSAISHGRDL